MKILRKVFSFSLGVILSRFSGLLREMSVAYLFGAGPVADAFFVAFRIPNLLRSVVGEGALNASLIPIYNSSESERQAKAKIGKIFPSFLVISLAVSVLGWFFSEAIVSAVAPGIREESHFALAVELTRWFFLYLFVLSQTIFLSAILNARGVFFPTTVSQAIFNLTFSGVLFLTYQALESLTFIPAVILGSLVQFLFVFTVALKHSCLPSFKPSLGEEVKEFLKRTLFSVSSLGLNQITVLISTAIASFLPVGSVSYLSYAHRVYNFPLGVVSVSFATVLLSVLSSNKGGSKGGLKEGLRGALLLSIPASAGLILLSEEVIRILFGRGAFGEEEVIKTAQILSFYCIGLPFSTLSRSLYSFLFSSDRTSRAVYFSLFYLTVDGVLAMSLALGLNLGPEGIALGSSIANLLLCASLFIYLRKDIKFPWKDSLRGIFATLVMVIALMVAKDVITDPLLRVAVIVPIGAGLYFLILLGLLLGESFVKKMVKS